MHYYKNTIGLAIRLETGQDVSSASNIVFNVRKPDGKKVTWSGSVYQTTKLQYITVSGDLNIDGWYTVYPTLTLGGWVGAGTPTNFLIEDPEKPDKRYNL